MTTVYKTVIHDQIIPKQPPEQAARGWVDNLLLQLQLDGFGIGLLPYGVPNDRSECKLPCTVYGCIFTPCSYPGLKISHSSCKKFSHYQINLFHFHFVS
jgi:hypothetical protein